MDIDINTSRFIHDFEKIQSTYDNIIDDILFDPAYKFDDIIDFSLSFWNTDYNEKNQKKPDLRKYLHDLLKDDNTEVKINQQVYERLMVIRKFIYDRYNLKINIKISVGSFREKTEYTLIEAFFYASILYHIRIRKNESMNNEKAIDILADALSRSTDKDDIFYQKMEAEIVYRLSISLKHHIEPIGYYFDFCLLARQKAKEYASKSRNYSGINITNAHQFLSVDLSKKYRTSSDNEKRTIINEYKIQLILTEYNSLCQDSTNIIETELKNKIRKGLGLKGSKSDIDTQIANKVQYILLQKSNPSIFENCQYYVNDLIFLTELISLGIGNEIPNLLSFYKYDEILRGRFADERIAIDSAKVILKNHMNRLQQIVDYVIENDNGLAIELGVRKAEEIVEKCLNELANYMSILNSVSEEDLLEHVVEIKIFDKSKDQQE